MNSLGVLFYSFLFAFNQLYEMVLWPMFSVELIGSPTYAYEDLDSFQMHVLDSPTQMAQEEVQKSGINVRLLSIALIFVIILQLVKTTSLSIGYIRDNATCVLDNAQVITGVDADFTETDLVEDISNYYPSMSIRFNGSSTGTQTILNKPADVLIWDRRMFNPL
ncbi:hypothetical protein KDRO_F02760 [Kluyveromyces lactis]|nr:hypothetical protein KDRO_F02760 [Kluyveromyces lactis]